MGTLNRCPDCKGHNIRITREVGCFWMVIFFVSLGFGLIMWPFLPRIAICKDCGARWKI